MARENFSVLDDWRPKGLGKGFLERAGESHAADSTRRDIFEGTLRYFLEENEKTKKVKGSKKDKNNRKGKKAKEKETIESRLTKPIIDILFQETCNLLKKLDALPKSKAAMSSKDRKQWDTLRTHLIKIGIPRLEKYVGRFQRKGLEWTQQLAQSVLGDLGTIKEKLEELEMWQNVEKWTVSNALKPELESQFVREMTDWLGHRDHSMILKDRLLVMQGCLAAVHWFANSKKNDLEKVKERIEKRYYSTSKLAMKAAQENWDPSQEIPTKQVTKGRVLKSSLKLNKQSTGKKRRK